MPRPTGRVALLLLGCLWATCSTAWLTSRSLAVISSAASSTPAPADAADRPAASADQPTREARAILQTAGIEGGLIVHVGCGDGLLTARLCAGESFLVEGLSTDAAQVAAARQYFVSQGLSGRVSARRFDGRHLPYVDNLVRLLVLDRRGEVSREEAFRVLAPEGVLLARTADGWQKTIKPRPAQMDHWTHYLHDASNNAVAHDSLVGPPRHMQFLTAPLWSRNHHKLASISSVVSDGRRIFYIVDEATCADMRVPGEWSVTARDAFSGVLLWKKRLPNWAWTGQKFRSGPVQLPRMLVVAQGRVFVPLGLTAPVSALDAATGKVLATYDQTANPEELIASDGVLLVVCGAPKAEQALIGPAADRSAWPNRKSVVAVDIATGKTLWRFVEPAERRIMPLSLASAQKRVYLAAGDAVLCLDLASGRTLWDTAPAGAATAQTPDGQIPEGLSGRLGSTVETSTSAQADTPGGSRSRNKKPADSGARKRGSRSAGRGPGWSVATLVVQQGVVLYANRGELTALDGRSGEQLWSSPCPPGFRSPSDVFVIDGLVWLGPDFSAGRDLKTGQVRRTSSAYNQIRTVGHHHRCFREKATTQWILTNYRGIELLDLVDGRHTRNNWVRGVCQYGIMPCNGLLYAPPHACGCFMEAKLYGFWALASERPAESRREAAAPAERLQRGSAPAAVLPSRTAAGGKPTDWPTLRHDPLRSGCTPAELPSRLAPCWQTKLGSRLSAPVVAEGTLLVADIDTHRVLALDAANGRLRWSRVVGGRVDSPPTIYRSRALFGCADGWVYCLRLSDGQLVWRFRAAPESLQTVALDRVESVWPVRGSVLVMDSVAYFAAGRSSYLDGGIHVYALDALSGKLLAHQSLRRDHPRLLDPASVPDAQKMARRFVQNATDYKTFVDPDRSDAFSMAGVTNDVLVSDGESIYLRHLRLDRNCRPQRDWGRHLFSTSSLLDDAENHRSHWMLGTGDFSRLAVAYSWIAYRPGNYGSRFCVPYGLMLCFDQKTIWGVMRKGGTADYVLFAENNPGLGRDEPHQPDCRGATPDNVRKFQWLVPLNFRPRAMLKSAGRLVLGGMPLPPEGAAPEELSAAFAGRKGGLLGLVDPADGEALEQVKLPAPPVWDGMAAAGGRLFMALADGTVLCLGAGQ